MEKRQVKWWKYEKDDKGNIIKVPQGVAVFHKFGLNFEELTNGVGMSSTAIIELQNGAVKNIPVEQITFIVKLHEVKEEE